MPASLLLVDDHQDFRRSARALLAAEGWEIVGEAGDGAAALTAARALRPAVAGFAPAGLILGAAYACLLVAFDHGRVSIVAPLNATQSLWAVVFAAAVIGTKHEAIGVRLVLAGALVVAGSSLIGIVR